MGKDDVIAKTIEFIKQKLQGEGSGHDWWHIYRVHKTSLEIARDEGANLFVVELGALLHDIADWKFTNGDEEEGGRQSRIWLESLGVPQEIINHVCNIVNNIGFKGGKGQLMSTIEGKVVQDADRLDAIGAIGIARTFAYAGHKGREIYNPDISPKTDQSKEEYRDSSTPAINHFYEKLLKLKDLMNTKMGRELAQKRHEFMKLYLNEFYEEWGNVK